MHLGLIDGHLAVFVADPEIDVVDLVLGADDPKVSAGEIMAIVELPHRLVGVDELQLQLLAGLVILEFEYPLFFRLSVTAFCSTADISSQPRFVARCPGCSEAGIHHHGTG